MERIGILQLGYETNTFVPGFAKLGDMGTGDWLPAHQVIGQFSQGRSAVSGALDAIRELGAQPVPLDMMTRGGAFNAGPTLEKGTAQAAMDHICDQISSLPPLDGLFFAMHGATCTEDLEDADAYFLSRLREVLPHIPIHCSMDLHGNITPQMCALCDGIFGIKCHPHTDFYEAGRKAASTLIASVRKEIRPQMALIRLPMLLGSASGNTLSGPGAYIRAYLSWLTQDRNLLDASFFHGFSAMDRGITGCSALVVADGYIPIKDAQELARHVWDLRREFTHPVYNATEAIRAALSGRRQGYALIHEGADNPGGGCPGDGTHLLRALVDENRPGTIMGPLYDPEAAALCHQHRPGDRFGLRLGGKTHPAFGAPLEAEAELLTLCDGTFRCENPMYRGMTMCYGPTARVRFSNVECIIVSRRFQTYDEQPFSMTGADLKNYQLVALKSMNHFRAWFKDRADIIITADTPSLYPADLNALPFRQLRRPIYPLDSATF